MNDWEKSRCLALAFRRALDSVTFVVPVDLVVVVVVVVVVVLTFSRIFKSVATRQAPVTLELTNTPAKNTHKPRWYTHISQLTQFMPPPETYKSEIESQSTMCQFHACAYVSLLKPGETNYSDCHPMNSITYISHVVYITTHTHDRRKSIGEKKQRRKEDKGKERKEMKTKQNEKGKKREEKDKESKKKQDRKRMQGKGKRRGKRIKKKKRNKNAILADPRNCPRMALD